MKFSQITLLGVATLAVAEHNHMHRHQARHGSPIEDVVQRDVTTVAPPVVTVFELGGQTIPWAEVEEGLESGKYVLIGDGISSVLSPTSTAPPSTSSTPVPTSSVEAAVFIQHTTSSSVYVAPTTSSTPKPSPSSPPASSSSSGSGNLNADFPSGTISCNTFPSAYGAVAVDYLNLEGWLGIQNTPDYSPGASSISYIVTAISGGCTKNSFCSYACPPGYQKSQWPPAQGSTGQSIGGLYCNADGMLELSRPSVPQICTPGAGGVTVTNNLGSVASICRTDYPGLESETVPLITEPGQTYEVCNPNSADYYTWEGSATSAQYYINPSGYGGQDACIWGTAGSNLGNWAPVNMGVGQDSTGMTYLSLFPNSPTNPDGKLDYDVTITGDVSGSCAYKGGSYISNGATSSTGCTVSSNVDHVRASLTGSRSQFHLEAQRSLCSHRCS
jgi:hypothetical protein